MQTPALQDSVFQSGYAIDVRAALKLPSIENVNYVFKRHNITVSNRDLVTHQCEFTVPRNWEIPSDLNDLKVFISFVHRFNNFFSIYVV